MTVLETVKKWLMQNPIIDLEMHIDTELLMSQSVNFALSRTPQSSIREFIDGSYIKSEYFTLLVKQNTQLESERETNDEFLENLESWVYTMNKNKSFPKLDANRHCTKIFVSSSYYLFETKEQESIYSLTLGINYFKEV